jgi:NAD(P)-dependent dehydrogenase (short-subunit alcohol dehydrogenase family)
MSDQVVVVLGTGGMGEAIARRCGTGKHIILADFNRQALARVETALRDDGYDVSTHNVDVSSRESVASLANVSAQRGDIVSVAHTAGLSTGPAKLLLRVNLLGVAYSLEEFGRVIAAGGTGVYIASTAGHLARAALTAEMESLLAITPTDELLNLPFLSENALPVPEAAYSLSKRGNQLRVQAASLEWAVRGARVNCISPGVIATPMGAAELSGPRGDSVRAMIEGSAAKRLGTAGEIAAAAAFLLGPDSTFITGTDLIVDGGIIPSLTAKERLNA